MRQLTYANAIEEALREELKRDKAVYLMGEKFGIYKRMEKGLREEFGSDRVRCAPIVEAAMIGAALGSSITGMRPVVEIAKIDFTGVCMDQIINEVAKYRYGSGTAMKLPLVIRTRGGMQGPATRSGTHHEQSLEALFTHIPGLLVVMPSTPYDVKGLLKSSIRADDPIVFIETESLDPEEGPVPEGEYLVPIGKADVKRAGTDITVVAWARTALQSLKAAEVLEKERISLEVIDLRTLKPLDEDAILNSVKKTGRLIVAHEACRTGGYGGEIAAIVAEKAFQYLKAPIRRVASLDSPIPYSFVLASRIVCNENNIVAAAQEIMGRPVPA